MTATSPDGAPPQGARWDGHGTRFAVWSEDASAVELCLYDELGGAEVERTALQPGAGGVWETYRPEVGPGRRYGYRAHGPWAPGRGQRFNPNKLLLDPCAHAIDRPARWHELLAGADPLDPLGSRRDPRDSAPGAPRSVVVDPRFDWGDDAPPCTPWRESVIYECHVKGLTALHPELPPELRGTFLGLASEPVIAHLLGLGVTAVELMPVQHCFSERALVERGRVNYWGYNTVGYFAPDARFAGAADPVGEFKTMVRALHRRGLEVILDVVYNHSGEGDELGPTLCLRGLGNAAYYRLDPRDPSRYLDVTGCGNTLNLEHPQTLRLVLASLRHWVEQMHVDGFRFDLAPALARGPQGVDFSRGLFAALGADPTLSRVKLIAEPWDVGPDGYRLGGFPPPFSEWNDRYRDCVRRFWRGEAGQLGELATRLGGSSDFFDPRVRTPQASLNFVACHDGLTLRDLTRGDGGRDDADGRVARGLLATLACSLGVPMLQQGDEMGRSQDGDANAYDRDDLVSWVRWDLGPAERALLAHAQRCLALRRSLGTWRRSEHFRGEAVAGAPRDVSWLRPEGGEMQAQDWGEPGRRVLGMWVCGHASDGRPDPRWPESLLLLNGSAQAVEFRLPPLEGPSRWRVLLDTTEDTRVGREAIGVGIALAPHAACLLQREGPGRVAV